MIGCERTSYEELQEMFSIRVGERGSSLFKRFRAFSGHEEDFFLTGISSTQIGNWKICFNPQVL